MQQENVQEEGGTNNAPICCIVIGMAGSGKTTLTHRLHTELYERNPAASYFINLDPAVRSVPFGANIDIRDTVNYKEVMSQYNLGPNGGILTSLNLFATRFDQVMSYVEKKKEVEHIMIDTPGQIEIFTWSASGAIITETLASTFPTVILYVVDTSRCTSPTTFMSNMLYAVSVVYKTKLPMVICFNKNDVINADFAQEWMTDCEKFQEALEAEKTYLSSLTHSMSLVLDEFYQTLHSVSISAMTGDGIDDLLVAIDAASEEYYKAYRPELDKRIAERKDAEEVRQAEQLNRLKEDILDGEGGSEVKLETDSSMGECEDHGNEDACREGSDSDSD